MSRWKIAGVVLGGVAVVAGAQVVRILWIGGAFRSIEPHFAGTCRLVKGPVGPEDITINQRTRRAYVSASDRRAAHAGRPVPGGIFAYDLDAAGAAPVNLTPDAGMWFQPHGISLWVEPDGREVLFVVNHPPAQSGLPAHTVEVFDVTGGTLAHRATLTDPLLVMPNDIVAVGVDRFYVTNTHANPPGRLQTIETYLQLRGAKILYYGPGGFRPAAENLVLPNGINVSADGRTVYVAAVTWRSVLVFERDPRTDALTLRREIAIDSGGDNIEVDPDGTLWIGSHPKLLAMAAYGEDPSKPAPAQVLRVAAAGDDYRVDEVFLDAGGPIAGASVAARSGNRLLIGQIFNDGFLDCVMEAQPGSAAEGR